MNKRGEVITLSLAVIAVSAIVIGFLFRPVADKILPIFGGQQKYVNRETVVTKPITIQVDGKKYLAEQVITTTNSSSEEAKMTLTQKVLALPKIIAVLVFLGFLFPPLGGFLLLAYNKLKAGFKQVVVGINEAQKELPKESVDVLQTNLSKKMDSGAKKLVKKIKVKL
jgi:hypothetical protein